jgi:hypothetical protein
VRGSVPPFIHTFLWRAFEFSKHRSEASNSAIYCWISVYSHLMCWQIQQLRRDSLMMDRLASTNPDDRRNVSDYWFNSVTWRIRSGALNVASMKVDNREHDARYA